MSPLSYARIVSALVYRNISAYFDYMFLVESLIFPALLIYVGGYSYDIYNQGVLLDNTKFPYHTFLTAGIIAFNTLWTCVISGNMIWNDKVNGMLEQFLVMPFTRSQYIISNLMTIVLLGLVGSAIIFVIGIPTLIGHIHITLVGIGYVLFALITCSLFFGSLVIIFTLKFARIESLSFQLEVGFMTGIFQFISFASSVWYPAEVVPEPFNIIFYINPLTYVTDIIRHSLMSNSYILLNASVLILSVITILSVSLAVMLMKKLKVE